MLLPNSVASRRHTGGECLLIRRLFLAIGGLLLRRFPSCVAPSLALLDTAGGSAGLGPGFRGVFNFTFILIRRLFAHTADRRTARTQV